MFSILGAEGRGFEARRPHHSALCFAKRWQKEGVLSENSNFQGGYLSLAVFRVFALLEASFGRQNKKQTRFKISFEEPLDLRGFESAR